MTEFSELNLAAPIAKALEAEGYKTPTPIQQKAIPIGLSGQDILGIAQTGTGKTAAFALPILDRLSRNVRAAPKRGAYVLVLAPTRELAAQIADSFRTYGKYLDLSVLTVFGGVPVSRQIKRMVRGVDVLVATPGRLLDLIDQRALTLKDVEVLVLDEADQMLDLGFIHALRRIVQLVPQKRQTMFFSATMPKSIAELASRYLTDPVQVAVAPTASTAERVTQHGIFVNQGEKQALLSITLQQPFDRALVFTRTKHGADKVVKQLAACGIESDAIHGNKSQSQRTRALEAFRSGKCKVLVATDIAARGIDIDNVSHVINFDIPNVPEQYVHRIGRTARAGREGLAISYISGGERPFVRDIERLTGIRLEMQALPEGCVAEAAKMKAARPAPQAPQQQQQPRPTSKDGEQKRGGPRRNRRGKPGNKSRGGQPSAKPVAKKQGKPRRRRAS